MQAGLRWWCWLVAGVAGSLPGQRDVGELLGRLPDQAVAVAVVDAADRAVAAIGETLGPLPEGLPPEVAGLVGAGLLALRASLRGSIGDVAALLAGDGIAVAVVPAEPVPQLSIAARPRDRDAALQWCRRFPERLHAALDGDVLLASSSAAGLALLREQRGVGRWRRFDFGPAPAGSVLRGAVDLVRVRERHGDPRVDDAGRFLLLPIVEALRAGSWLTFDVAAGRTLSIEIRADATVSGSPRGELLLRPGAHRRIVPLADDGLALVSLDRSLQRLFSGLERFLDPAGVLAVQGFLSIADALDGPRCSFVDDLLGRLEEPFVLHVLPAIANDGEPRSPLRLPELALVAGMRGPEVEDELFRIAQVLVTIANAERVQRGQGVFRMRRVADESGTRLVAEPPDFHGPGLPPVDRQLSPTVWCGHGMVVVATTEPAARRIVERAANGASVAVCGDVVEMRGPAIAALLGDNRGPFELARMFDEGEDDVAARRFVDVVLAVAAAIERVTATTEVDPKSTCFRLVVERRR